MLLINAFGKAVRKGKCHNNKEYPCNKRRGYLKVKSEDAGMDQEEDRKQRIAGQNNKFVFIFYFHFKQKCINGDTKIQQCSQEKHKIEKPEKDNVT